MKPKPRVITRRIIVERDDRSTDVLVLWPTGRVTFHADRAAAETAIRGQSRAIAERWNAMVIETVEWRL